MTRRSLPGFHYDAKRKRLVLDGRVTGTKTRRQKTVDNVTRDQALVAWKAFRADLESGRAIEGPLTLRQFVQGYYEVIAAGHSRGTRTTEGVIIRNHLLRYFGDTLVAEITTIRVIDFKADMRARACSPSYINNAVRVLKHLLRQAVERDVIEDYPIRKKVPKEQEVPLRLEMKGNERQRFFAAFDDEQAFRSRLDARRRLGPVRSSDHFGSERRFGGGMHADREAAAAFWIRFRDLREFFVVAVESGLRLSDLRNLQWSSIEMEAGFIRLVMQKTRRVAIIPISVACRDALRACQAKSVASVFVFADGRGQPFSLTRIRRVFAVAKELAGITRRLRIHDLRHTFGCRLADQSVSLQKIATALGHTSTRMAERYAHPSEESMQEIRRALDADPILPKPDTITPMARAALDGANRK